MFRYVTEATELLAALAPTLQKVMARSPRREGTHPGTGDRGRSPEGVRDPRRNPAAHRLGRYGLRPAAADTAYQGTGFTATVPQRRRRKDPDTGRYRCLSRNREDVNAAHARHRDPGERVNAELKNWRILRKIRTSPNTAGQLIAAVQTLMIASA
ncbi:transposase family protein [Pseudonocardia sp. Ae717_Ps2]|uniref:transposase family protein n=1 Tax=Pseudonocardia sp. Ae717_Ps2 TaxID=1885573 RepID=UPI001E41A9E6|nr:transposase family protein [Pseudonocardia sp. Ae717_Ps2]